MRKLGWHPSTPRFSHPRESQCCTWLPNCYFSSNAIDKKPVARYVCTWYFNLRLRSDQVQTSTPRMWAVVCQPATHHCKLFDLLQLNLVPPASLFFTTQVWLHPSNSLTTIWNWFGKNLTSIFSSMQKLNDYTLACKTRILSASYPSLFPQLWVK